MKKWILTLLAIFALFLIPAVADGAERSSDTMILDWSPIKYGWIMAISAYEVLFIINAVI